MQKEGCWRVLREDDGIHSLSLFEIEWTKAINSKISLINRFIVVINGHPVIVNDSHGNKEKLLMKTRAIYRE